MSDRTHLFLVSGALLLLVACTNGGTTVTDGQNASSSVPAAR
ncbi:MAG: hypothetical protein AAB728_00960 [Patescibacteria group bacterium]